LTTKIPFVTVLMPIYNGSEFLGEAIESILNQTYSDFEFLIIDDGSTDQSIDLIKTYDDPRIRLIMNKKNIGQSATLNKGLDLARGEYIARMDQDDISIPERIKKQLKFMENNSDVDVCGSWLQLFGKYNGINQLPIDSEKIKVNLLTNQNLAHPTVMIRKSTLVKYDFNYNPNYSIAQDYDLWIRMSEYCTFFNIPEPLVKYRMHENQNSIIAADRSIIESNRSLNCLMKRMGIQLNDHELILHKKIFRGVDIESLIMGEVFRYLMHLRSRNFRKKIFEPIVFNEFLRIKWRRFMLNKKSKILYWVSVLFFFRPNNIAQTLYNHIYLKQ
jgi:glycosyltransferase involved in cell wall biosynthesis